MATTIQTRRTTAPRRPGPAEGAARSGWAHLAVVVIGVFAFVPILWMVVTAFTAPADIFTFPPKLVRAFTVQNLASVVTDAKILRFLANGMAVSALTAFVSIALGFGAGYAFSKFRFIGRGAMLYSIFIAQMIPGVLLLLTLYQAFNAAHLLNTYAALVLSYTTFALPLSVWMMKNSLDAIPDELIEAARIDGSGEFRIMFQVILPLTNTSLIAIGLFAFVQAWNDLVYALTLVNTPLQTLPAGLAQSYLGEFQNSYGEMMAASFVTAIPILAVFLVLQKQFVSGALAGSAK